MIQFLSSWVNVMRKVPIINFSRRSKAYRAPIFFFEVRKIFSTKSEFFSVYLRSLLFSNCPLATLTGCIKQ